MTEEIFCAWIYLEALDSAFEEHEERRVGVGSLPLPKNGFGLQQACLRVCGVQSKERLHDCVVPQEGQAVRNTHTHTHVQS